MYSKDIQGDFPPSIACSSDSNMNQDAGMVRMLKLAIAQIELALRDSKSSIEAVSDVFISTAGALQQISGKVDGAVTGNGAQSYVLDMKGLCEETSRKSQAAVVGLQFFDRLSQRLGHACLCLSELSREIDGEAQGNRAIDWRRLENRIRGEYNMEEERIIHDAVVNGASPGDISYLPRFDMVQATQGETDVELF